MSLLKRLKTLWHLSGMEIKTNTSRDVYLKDELAQGVVRVRQATMASIVDMNPPNYFEDHDKTS